MLFNGFFKMSTLLTIIAISLKVLPLTCHRLITTPEQEWDSVIVSSDPITIREKNYNDTKHNEIVKPQKRSYDCPENDFTCLYGSGDKPQDSNQIVDKFLQQYSHIADVKYNENENSRKSYWSTVDSQPHNHPYDDQKGWVTLDPVPWSNSKISKWRPNKVGEKPWEYESTTQRPVQQFWVPGSNYHPQRPSFQWGVNTNDLITDNKPSDFPTGHYQGSQYHPENGVYGHGGSYNQQLQGNPPRQNHPSTYPTHGDGEWILLSTTKGYSNPQRHRWPGQSKSSRKIMEISKYHEEDLNGENRNGIEEIRNSSEKTPVQILYTGSPKDGEGVAMLKRKVRLQVLPSLESSSSSYGGMLEVDSNSQTVDEAQQEDEKLNKLKAIANIKKNKIRGYKLVPTSKITGKGMNQKNVMTLAAVGAGMIPATMALLVPMALGRKKRSASFPNLKKIPLKLKQITHF